MDSGNTSYDLALQLLQKPGFENYNLIKRQDGSVIIQDPKGIVSVGIPANYTGSLDLVYYWNGNSESTIDLYRTRNYIPE